MPENIFYLIQEIETNEFLTSLETREISLSKKISNDSQLWQIVEINENNCNNLHN